MKKKLLLLVIMSVLLVSCVKLGSSAPSGRVPDNATDVTGAMAQNPGGMQSLPGVQPGSSGSLPSLQGNGQSGSLGGFNQPPGSPSIPAGVPVPPNMAQFNLSGQGQGQSSGIGELQDGGQGGGSGGDLPVLQGSGPTGTMSGFKAPPDSSSKSMPAGVPVEKLPFFEKDLSADTALVTVNDAVFLNWKVIRADSVTLQSSKGKTYYLDGGKVGFFVVPDLPDIYTYTVTAANSYGSVSQKVDVAAISPGQRPKYEKYSRCRTFMVYPQKIKPGEAVTVYWNVLDAETCYLENNITNSLTGLPDLRDKVNAYGEMQFLPRMDTMFRLSHLNGAFPPSRSGDNYSSRDCFVEVR
jgi:hypothetical protein